MSQGEYLRRKMECQTKVYGPSRVGESGVLTMINRFKANANCPTRNVTPLQNPTCCVGKTPYWRERLGRPDGGPYGRAGDGQQQEWSSDFLREKAAGRAVCVSGQSGYIIQAGCPPESTPENPATGLKAIALEGKQTCCPYITAKQPEIDCSCALQPGRIDTLAANDMPSDRIVVPSENQCCSITFPPPPPPVEPCYIIVDGYVANDDC
jgi:hypothetical protein